MMDKDRIAGSLKQATGSVRETAGKATGDRALQAEGAVQKTEGRARKRFGGWKDRLRPYFRW